MLQRDTGFISVAQHTLKQLFGLMDIYLATLPSVIWTAWNTVCHLTLLSLWRKHNHWIVFIDLKTLTCWSMSLWAVIILVFSSSTKPVIILWVSSRCHASNQVLNKCTRGIFFLRPCVYPISIYLVKCLQMLYEILEKSRLAFSTWHTELVCVRLSYLFWP